MSGSSSGEYSGPSVGSGSTQCSFSAAPVEEDEEAFAELFGVGSGPGVFGAPTSSAGVGGAAASRRHQIARDTPCCGGSGHHHTQGNPL